MALTDEPEPEPGVISGRTWLDNNPYCLMIVPEAEPPVAEVVDLGEPGWIAKHSASGLMRAAGSWYLVRKTDGVIVAMMLVLDGEQPYYVRRHVGVAGTDSTAETSAFGIGKKRLDGHVDRLWVMANGCVTLGDDLEPISVKLLKQGLI